MSKAFISYSHADTRIVDRLHVHMSMLKKENKITAWYDQNIIAGSKLDNDINSALKDCDIFLAIVSPDYLNSNYCYEKEFKTAIDMQERGEILIVPIIAQPCDWKSSPLGQYKAIPKDGKPISEWTNENVAFLNIIDELRRLVDDNNKQNSISLTTNIFKEAPTRNYRVKRDFDAIDKLNFLEQSFNSIKAYFSASLEEVNEVDYIKAQFLNHEAKSFSCIITNRAKINSVGYITIVMGANDTFNRNTENISYSLSQNLQNNPTNKFTIAQSDYELYWSTGNSMYSLNNNQQSLSAKDIADKLWLEFLSQVGIVIE